MKNPKIGEKINVYVQGEKLLKKTSIISVSDDAITVLDLQGALRTFDRRQCVRLIKKERREWWVAIPKDHLRRPVCFKQKTQTSLTDGNEYEIPIAEWVLVKEVRCEKNNG